MPVTQRGASWQAQVNHKGGRYRRNFDSKQAAQLWEAESKSRLLKGLSVDMGEGAALTTSRKDGAPHTLGELVEHVFDTHWKPKASGQSQAQNARELVGLIGPGMPITKLTRMDVDKARAKLLETGNQPATVNRKVAALSTCLTIYGDSTPEYNKPKLAKYRESEGRIRRFTPAEEAAAVAFYDHIGCMVMADYVLLSLDTGLRQGEVLELRFQDAVNKDAVTVWGTGAKSGKTRSVPLTARAKGILSERYKAAGRDPRKLVFEGFTRDAIRHYWLRLTESLGLSEDPQFVPHILRHEFCSRLSDRGLNAAVIQALAGHSSLTVTQRYIKVGAQALIDAIQTLEAKEEEAREVTQREVATSPEMQQTLAALVGWLQSGKVTLDDIQRLATR